jgi:hypothetical protein
MKPVQVGIIVVVSAVSGALAVKFMQKPAAEPVAAVAPVASAPFTLPAPAAPAPVPVAAAEPAEAKPSPLPEKRPAAPKPASNPAGKPAAAEPATTARAQPPVAPAQPAPPVTVPETPVARTTPEPPAPPPPPPPPPEPQKVTLKAGLLLPVRIIDGLSSERNQPGDQFTATLDQPLQVDGFIIAERGSRLEGKVVASDKGGRVKGVSTLAVELTRMTTSDGQKIAITTESFEKHGEQSRTEDAAKVGGGAALGAIIGAIAGGGKGAAIGAGVGGAAGAGGVMATRGKAATIPSETRISFRLREAVTVTERR